MWRKLESEERAVRRRLQRLWAEGAEALAEYRATPEYRRRERNRKRRRWPDASPWMVDFLCSTEGRDKGGRPPAARRCTRRVGSRFCWNWSLRGTDRCWRHERSVKRVHASRNSSPGGDRFETPRPPVIHDLFCGARKHTGPGTCRQPAGWGTTHDGVGRCKLHGGATPIKTGRYSTFRRETLFDLMLGEARHPTL